MNLFQTINTKLAAAFEACGYPTEHATARPADRPDLADLQCNGALAIAKPLGKNPREIAQSVVDALADESVFTSIEIAGPGFINLKLTDAFLAQFMAQADERFGTEASLTGEHIVLDYAQPNVAKEMHVGHLRSAIVGEALKNLWRFAGARVTGDSHLGDWGKPYGMLIEEFRRQFPESPYFIEGKTDGFPTDAEFPLNITEITALYKQASARCKEDADADEKARQTTFALQDGHTGYTALWQQFRRLSVDDIQELFGRLGTHHELFLGESHAHAAQVELEKVLTDKGLLIEDKGAKIVRVGRDPHGNDMPPMIYRTRDGSYGYGSSDLGTIKNRLEMADKPTRIDYLVDERQRLHFMQVFDVSRQLEWTIPMEFLGFGTINGTDGKPFKTRSGDALRLRELLDDTTALARAELPDSSDEIDLDKLAADIAVAAIKFQDLRNARASDYVFNQDEFMRFEGKTGPYLQYAIARSNSLLAKAASEGAHIASFSFDSASVPPAFLSVDERKIMLKLAEFPLAISRALDKADCSQIAHHAYELAQLFSTFYANSPILNADSEAEKSLRLQLVTTCRDQLKLCLQILGIPTPEKMVRKS